MATPDVPPLRADVLPLRAAGRLLLPHLRPHRRALLAAVALSLVGAAGSVAQPLLVGGVVDRVGQGAGAGGGVGAAAGLLVAVVLATALLDAVRGYLLERAGAGTVLGVRRSLLDRLVHLTVAARDARTSGDLLSRVGADTATLQAVVTSGLFDLLGTVLTFVGVVVVMALLDAVLLAVTLTAVLVAFAVVLVLSRRAAPLQLAEQRAVGDMSSAVGRVLGALRTLRASGATATELGAVQDTAARARDAAVRLARLRAVLNPVMGIATYGAFAAVLGVGGARVASGATSVADLVSFVLLLFTVVAPLGQFVGVWTSVQSALGALTRVQEVLELPVEEETARHPVPAPRPGAPLLAFEDVAFTHADGTTALAGVTFALRPGTRTALVGPSGAGKSTLLSLVERFHDVDAGAVRLDGVDVRDLPRAALRARLGHVEQDAPVLAGTLRANLLLAAPRAGDGDVRAALETVGLGELLAREGGLDAEVGEGGVLLSGGQRQRLAIARTLLAGADLLLLDEPTASLDARNEALLRDTLRAAAAGGRRSLLVVAHRLSTVVDSDQIVVLDGGRVVGVGRHEELLGTTPLYRELAATQLLLPGH